MDHLSDRREPKWKVPEFGASLNYAVRLRLKNMRWDGGLEEEKRRKGGRDTKTRPKPSRSDTQKNFLTVKSEAPERKGDQ